MDSDVWIDPRPRPCSHPRATEPLARSDRWAGPGLRQPSTSADAQWRARAPHPGASQSAYSLESAHARAGAGLSPSPGASAPCAEPPPSLLRHDLERLQHEMGFSRHQIEEALRRCSTLESIVDWIVSEEREWNLQPG